MSRAHTQTHTLTHAQSYTHARTQTHKISDCWQIDANAQFISVFSLNFGSDNNHSTRVHIHLLTLHSISLVVWLQACLASVERLCYWERGSSETDEADGEWFHFADNLLLCCEICNCIWTELMQGDAAPNKWSMQLPHSVSLLVSSHIWSIFHESIHAPLWRCSLCSNDRLVTASQWVQIPSEHRCPQSADLTFNSTESIPLTVVHDDIICYVDREDSGWLTALFFLMCLRFLILWVILSFAIVSKAGLGSPDSSPAFNWFGTFQSPCTVYSNG